MTSIMCFNKTKTFSVYERNMNSSIHISYKHFNKTLEILYTRPSINTILIN